MANMKIVHTKVQRRFQPHLLLLDGARHHLAGAKSEPIGAYYGWLGAIIMCALSIESIGNSYGELLISKWRDQIRERISKGLGASSKWKLEYVATFCGVAPDFKTHPWSTALELTEFRNGIAHASRKHMITEDDCSLDDYTRMRDEFLEADIEKFINEKFATESCDAIEQIIKTLNGKLTDSQLHELNCRGHEFHAFISPAKSPT